VPGDEGPVLINLWKEGGIFIYEDAAGKKTPVLLEGEKDADDKQAARVFETGELLKDEKGEPLRLVAGDLNAAETDSTSRTAMKAVQDLRQLSAPDWRQRMRAA
jgi:urea transport system permease protein